ncbi:hypothetical protein [Streptomyces sp. NBC_00322]|uniref:hypothetical protein n=1 Tax=Streptomyces sp. NBC_00322 TaxID=2975712 RepID=UPI003FA7B102
MRFAGATVMVAGAVWTHSQPSAAMLDACKADPSPASMPFRRHRDAARNARSAAHGVLHPRLTAVTVFDDSERRTWAGRAEA